MRIRRTKALVAAGLVSAGIVLAGNVALGSGGDTAKAEDTTPTSGEGGGQFEKLLPMVPQPADGSGGFYTMKPFVPEKVKLEGKTTPQQEKRVDKATLQGRRDSVRIVREAARTRLPLSEAQFNKMFKGRNPFYTYSGLKAAAGRYPKFADMTGSWVVAKRETAAFLSAVDHETGGMTHIVEENTANYPTYCDGSKTYGCPAGKASYYARGPLQLTWNYNYKAAGDALGVDLLGDPKRVETDSMLAWQTALWFWMTQKGAGRMTAHDAIANRVGFGETVRTLNGAMECEGRNGPQVLHRIQKYRLYLDLLGATPGSHISC